MTATDDNGESNTATIEIVVKAKPADGFLESITNAVGGVGTLVIGILAIIVIGLAAFLLFTRNSGSSSDKYSDSTYQEPAANLTNLSQLRCDAGWFVSTRSTVDPYAAYNTQPQASICLTTSSPSHLTT